MAERLSVLNQEPKKLPGPTLLHQLVQPGSQRLAIDSYDGHKRNVRISYHELHTRSDRLAQRLQRLIGDNKRAIVPLLLSQQASLYIAQLAILKAGAAFCPLPLDAPEDRLRFILKDVNAKTILTSSDLRSRVPDTEDVTSIDVDEDPSEIESITLPQDIATDDLAYVMYTSGSTGLPKGVLLSHAAVTQALLAHDRHIPQFSRFLQVAAPTFDVSVFEIFFTLFRGQTLVCCDRTQLLSDLPGTISSLQIDAAELTPSVASNLLGDRDGVPGLRVLLTIGEMLKKDVIEQYGGSSTRPAVLHGMYGPTEAAIHCTVQPDFSTDMTVNNIGRPLDTVSAFVLSAPSDGHATEILPYGEEGELAIGGYQLADGYLNRDEQTRAAFFTHPTYGRLYRTGDKARFVGDGKIECLGRISGGQIKLRGQRLELGEVEYAVSKTPGCTGTVAEVISDSLVVFCKGAVEMLTEEMIYSTCKKWLPAYMVPSDIMIRSSLPYLASGKLDRRTLRSEFEDSRKSAVVAKPLQGSEIDEKVLQVVHGVLGKHSVRGDDFRLASIDSLSAIRLCSALGKIGNVRPMATHVMEARTIRDLSDLVQDTAGMQPQAAKEVSDLLIKQRLERAMLTPALSSRRLEIEIVLPCSAVQSAMLAETSIDSRRYCNWIEFEVDKHHSIRAVKQALQRLMDAHPLLRSTFLYVAGTGGGSTLVTWRQASHDWLDVVDKFDYDYSLDGHDDLLQGCHFQILDTSEGPRVLLSVHHALYDQWSVDVVVRDVSLLLAGQAVQAYSFAEVIKYYTSNVDLSLSAESIAFWTSQVADLESTALPNMNSVQTTSEQKRTPWTTFDTPSELLLAQAREHSWSAHSYMQAAFAVLLSFMHGSRDICYGTVFSGRHLPIDGIEDIFGPCLTTLPVRLIQDDSCTWLQLVQAIHTKNREVLQHSSTPLSQIKRLSPLDSNESLFDTLFLWQESTITSAGPQSIREVASADCHEFKLVLEGRTLHGHVESRLTFDTSFMPTEQANLFLAQIEAVLGVILRYPNEPIRLLDHHLTADLMSISNPNPAEDAQGLDLSEVLEAASTSHADHVAIAFAQSLHDSHSSTVNLTYIELHSRANQLARHLRSVGVKEDDLVCICMEKSIDFYTAILAVVKSGAGYLPLVPETKMDRVKAILSQAKVKATLTDQSGVEHFHGSRGPVLQPSDWHLGQYSPGPLKLTAKGSSVAYTVFTSGSTGTPKGVVVTRANLLGNIITLQNLYKADPGDRMLQACLQSFDVAVFEIFFSFYTGMTICTATKEVLFDDLEHAIRTLQVTHLSLTPSVASLVHPDNVPSVRFLVTAGEAMTAAVHSAWADRGLHQGYGPSETTNICTVNLHMTPLHHLGSIGPPFRNTSAFVIDASGDRHILPRGAFGEFVFGGEQVFRGYLGLDELNQEKIWEHPHYGRLYRSGDLGRILADGSLLIHGRSDFQVKIRGNRVELGEISSVLLRQSTVSDSVTIVDNADNTTPRLLSFWTSDNEDRAAELPRLSGSILATNTKLFQAMADYLPSYMMPSLLVPLANLPRTEQGKMDHRALRRIATGLTSEQRAILSGHVANVDEVLPVGENEALVSSALCDVLNLQSTDFDRNSRLEALGLTSINAVYLAKALQKQLQHRVPVSLVLRSPTLARLARAVAEPQPCIKRNGEEIKLFGSDFEESIRMRYASEGKTVLRILPCTPLQEAMLAASTGAASSYCNSSTYKINCDVERLRECFEQAIQRHDILRTVFVQTAQADRPYAQVVLKDVELPWSTHLEHDVTSGNQLVGVSPDSPVRISCTKSSQACELTLHMHHATYDGTSIGILLDEVEALYHGSSLLPPPSAHEFLTACLQQSGSEAQQFWTSVIHEYTPQPFPVRELKLTTEQLISHSMSEAHQAVQSYCERHLVSVSSVLQATWASCLCTLQQIKDVCFGTVVSGRLSSIADVERLVFPCFNIVPVRVILSTVATNEDLTKQLSRLQTRTAPYQLTSLRSIQQLSTNRSERLFDSLLLVQGPARECDEQIWQPVIETGDMGFPLVLEVIPSGKDLSLQVYYQSRYLDSDQAQVISTLFAETLAMVISQPKAAVSGEIGSAAAGILKTSQNHEAVASDEDASTNWCAEEHAVVDVLSTLSRTDKTKIRRTTTIYELGLDSLNAAQIAAQLRRQGYDIDLADVMEHRTPARIARAMLEKRSNATKEAADFTSFDEHHRRSALASSDISEEAIEAVRPCTAAQLGMLSQSIATDGELYVNHVHLQLPQGVSGRNLWSALRQVQALHPMLRTIFARTQTGDASHMMLVLKSQSASLPELKQHLGDCQDVDLSVAADIVHAMEQPLWRARLLKTSVVALSLHHAIYDATSIHMLQVDLADALYGGLIRSSYCLDPVITENMNHVEDHAQRFWHDALSTAEFISFPALTARQVKVREIKSCNHLLSLSREEVDALCKQRHCTMQAAGQAAWAYLLSTYLGESNIIFGTVLSTRSADTAKHIFPSINTVPIAAQENGVGLLESMTAHNGRLQRYRLTPLSDIQRYAGRPGEALFDTLFVLQVDSSSSSERVLPIIHQSSAVDYKLSLELGYGNGDVDLTLSYATTTLDEAHAELVLRQYELILLNLLRNQDDLLDGCNRDLLSVTTPAFSSLPSPVQLLHDFISFSAENNPDAAAMEFISDLEDLEHRTWTYSQLGQLSDRLASILQQNGAKPDGVIAVCMNKCPEASFCFPAILKTGSAFLAMDPELPKARKEFILKDSQADILLVDESVSVSDLQTTARIMTITMDRISSDPSPPFSPVDIDPQSTCYCLYTSGTTGTPKGCEVTHENAVQAMMSFQRLFSGHWTASSRWLQFASYWFDVSILEHFWSWSVGITMIGAPRDIVLTDLVHFINEANITHIDLTPSLARLLQPEDVPSLCNGVFITGGEALKQEIIQKWGKHHVICNGYGPTEATIGVTMNPFIGSDAKPANIGPPFANVGSYILDSGNNQPVLRGAIGELCISGKLVGKGYLGRPDLTEKSFPTLEHLGERIYRTGDLVRQLADGSFLFIGRMDSQAKLRGQRLELDEIDEIIKAASAPYNHVASLVIKSEDANKQILVSFVASKALADQALRSTRDSSIEELIRRSTEACVAHLPGYMVPTTIVPLNHIPLTVNNKVDVKALAAFYNRLSAEDIRALSTGQDHDSATASEKIIAVVAEMLSIDAQGIDGNSNLFALGLSSVSAITLVHRLRTAGYKNADIATVMRTPQLGRLSRLLERSGASTESGDTTVRQTELFLAAIDRRYRRLAAKSLEIAVDEIEIVTPCTALQNGLLVESMQQDKRPYFNSFSFRCEGLEVPKLQRAIQTLSSNVQILRATFLETDDGFMQAILRQPILPFEQSKCIAENLRQHLHKAKQAWISANHQQIVSPFAVLVTHCDEKTVVTLHLHHAIYDGISLGLLMNALALTYSEREAEFGPPFTTALAHGPLHTVDASRQFWSESLSDMSYQPITRSVPDHKQTSASKTFNVDFTKLEQLRKTLGVSHQAIVQTAFEVSLRSVHPQITSFGIVVSGRSIPFEDADQVIGPLFNTLPARIIISAQDTWRDLVHRCHERNITTIPYQFTPLRSIKKWCGYTAEENLFDTLFVFQIDGGQDPAAATFGELLSDQPQAEYPLAFDATLKAEDVLEISLVAQQAVAANGSLEKLTRVFLQALDQMAADLQSKVEKSFEGVADSMEPRSPARSNKYEHLNGVHNFTWTEEAKKIRAELVDLFGLTANEIDEHSTVFGLGLDSIDAVRLSSKLRKSKIVLPVSAIIKAQTIPRMIQACKSSRDVEHVNHSIRLRLMGEQLQAAVELPSALERDTVERILPATPSQEGLLALMKASDLQHYFNHDLLRIDAATDIVRLGRAWQTVSNKHSILRTSFVEVDAPGLECVFAQVIHRHVELSFPEVTLKTSGELKSLMRSIKQDVSDTLDTKPAFRITAVVLDGARFLLLSLSHALYDGHSLALLHQDVSQAYHGDSIDRPSPDVAIDRALQAISKPAHQFWQGYLHGAEPCKLLIGPQQEKESEPIRQEIVSTVSAVDARNLCRKQAMSMQTLGQTCWSLTLAHLCHRTEVLFGTVLACRDSEEAEQTMFPTMNTVIVRATLHGSRADLMNDLQSIAVDMLPYKQTPLRNVRSAIARTDRRTDDLFDTLFVFQQPPKDTPSRTALYHSQTSAASIDYPLAVELELSVDSIILRAATNNASFSGQKIKSFLQIFDSVLQSLVCSPERPCVTFKGEMASICELPFFRNTSRAEDVVASSTPSLTDLDRLDSSSDLYLEIVDALHKVSSVPVDQIEPDMTLESLGIDSVSAIKVSAILRKRGIKIAVSSLIKARSISTIKAANSTPYETPLDNRRTAKQDLQAIISRTVTKESLRHSGVSHDNVVAILPATAGQVYMLGSWRMSAGRLFYPTFQYHLAEDVSSVELQTAWRQLIEQHTILRTVLCSTGDDSIPVVQLILKEVKNDLVFGRDWPDQQLSQPLFSLKASRSRSGWNLSLKIHHALYDAISLPLLMGDLSHLVAQQPLHRPQATFDQYLALTAITPVVASAQAFWQDYLSGGHSTHLQLRPRRQASRRVEVYRPAYITGVSRLDALARKLDINVQCVLFAIWAKLYLKLANERSGQEAEDAIIGIYLSNRGHMDDMLDLRDPTVNLLPLRVRKAAVRSLSQLAQEVQTDLRSIGELSNSATSLWEIFKWTGIQIDSFVNLLRLPESADNNSDVKIKSADDSAETERVEVVDVCSDGDFSLPRGLKEMPAWRDVYKDSLDVELRIANDELDVGIFGLETLASLDEVQDILVGMRQEVAALVG